MPKKKPKPFAKYNVSTYKTGRQYYKVLLPAIFIALIIAYIILVIFHTKLSLRFARTILVLFSM